MSGEGKDAGDAGYGGWGWDGSSDWGMGNLDIMGTMNSLAEQAQAMDVTSTMNSLAEQAHAIDLTSSVNYAAEQASKMAKDIELSVDAGLGMDATTSADPNANQPGSNFGLDWMGGGDGGGADSRAVRSAEATAASAVAAAATVAVATTVAARAAAHASLPTPLRERQERRAVSHGGARGAPPGTNITPPGVILVACLRLRLRCVRSSRRA